MLHVKLIEPPCTERYARWCERSKIPHQEEFSPTRFWTLPNRSRQTVVVVKSGQDDLSQTLYSQKWPKSVFEIVVRIERKKISAVNVPNGVSDVPIGTSQFCRCCATIKSEKVSATNDRLLSLVHRMFTNIYPAFCRGNVRCKVKGGLEQQRARFYRGARFRISLILSHRNLVGECLPQTLLYAA